jgi:integrase/recombinase XerD
MAGRRPLTHDEERRLLRVVRNLKPRDRAMVTAQWFTGFRISEVLSLTVASVWRNDQLVPNIGITPRHLKGHDGRTRWVPVLPELSGALHRHLAHLRRKYALTPDLPLFLSRKGNPDSTVRAITREAARQVIRGAFAGAGIEDDGRLGTHTLRKTFARSVYQHSGNDLMVLKSALGHSDVAVTQKYLEVDENRVAAAIAKVDFTRKPRKAAPVTAPVAAPEAPVLTAAA